jgi:Glycerophosphoryl diester phosphodiesterase family
MNYRIACAFAFFAIPLTAAEPTPLERAHAHNDYEHKRPLLDALGQGFGSVEADIFLLDGRFLVAHTPFELKPERTLQKLYLDPLREKAKANGGRVFKDGPAFHLMIDVKTEAKPTWAALAKVLEDYDDILTVTRDGKTETKAVTVVISGNWDREGIKNAKVRRAAIDGRPKDLDGNESAELIPWVSASWGSLFKWKGDGPMPRDELKKLKDHVAKAHAQKRKVRFWATPDRAEAWAVQRDAGVDFINTDKLVELRAFLGKK